jgi:hypothetical protein
VKNGVTLTSSRAPAPISYPADGLPGWRGDETLAGKADAALQTLQDKSPGLSQMLTSEPVAATLAAAGSYDAREGYSQLRPRLRELYATLTGRYSEQLTLHYGLVLLATLIADHEKNWPTTGLEAQLEPCFIDSFHRILTAVARGGAQSLRLDTDAFAKELAICLYRLIPAGGQLVDPGAAFPRGLLVRRPTRQMLAATGYLLLNVRGFAPFALFHTSLFQRHWFTAAGWEFTFHCLPAVFRSFPRLKGLLAISWFCDPALLEISPELHFLQDIPRRWGAVFLPVGPEPGADSDALLLSRHRRQLFEAGRYVPRKYAFVVSRQDVLAREGLARK